MLQFLVPLLASMLASPLASGALMGGLGGLLLDPEHDLGSALKGAALGGLSGGLMGGLGKGVAGLSKAGMGLAPLTPVTSSPLAAIAGGAGGPGGHILPALAQASGGAAAKGGVMSILSNPLYMGLGAAALGGLGGGGSKAAPAPEKKDIPENFPKARYQVALGGDPLDYGTKGSEHTFFSPAQATDEDMTDWLNNQPGVSHLRKGGRVVADNPKNHFDEKSFDPGFAQYVNQRYGKAISDINTLNDPASRGDFLQTIYEKALTEYMTRNSGTPAVAPAARTDIPLKNQVGSFVRGFSKGGAVKGPGGPKDDMVPAMTTSGKRYMLSNGEHVMNAGATKAIGHNVLDMINKKYQ